MLRQPPDTRERHETVFLRASRKNQHCRCFNIELRSPQTWKNIFLLSYGIQLVVVVTLTLGTNTKCLVQECFAKNAQQRRPWWRVLCDMAKRVLEDAGPGGHGGGVWVEEEKVGTSLCKGTGPWHGLSGLEKCYDWIIQTNFKNRLHRSKFNCWKKP